MQWTNPVTQTTYESFEEYVQSLCDSYRTMAREKHGVETDERLLCEALNEAAGELDKTRGTLRVKGVKQQAKVERRQNVSYDSTKGQEHPLRKLLQVFPQLADMVRVRYEEKGAGVSDLISRYHDHALHKMSDRELVEEILKVRQVKSGKPGITIEDRKDV